jgi:hypothetical protein
MIRCKIEPQICSEYLIKWIDLPSVPRVGDWVYPCGEDPHRFGSMVVRRAEFISGINGVTLICGAKDWTLDDFKEAGFITQ